MGFMDKLKNIFFEEEEEEEIVEDVPKKEKIPEKEVMIKKVEIPKKSEKLQEVEIKPIEEEVVSKREVKNNDLIFDDEDFILEQPKPKRETPVYHTETTYKTRDSRDLYKKEEMVNKKESVKCEYRSEDNNSKKNFTPSPIISPIYGILDKNYKKEEVKERKEIRLSSRPSKMDFDSVRNKAFGDLENEIFAQIETIEPKQEQKPREFRKIYDMSNKKEKPIIEKVTIGEADEYFNDLGLAYNTDYKDISKELSDGKVTTKKDDKNGKLEDNLFDLIESMYDKED